jgi:PAT family beta-lactamase induction signal transducer AmpG
MFSFLSIIEQATFCMTDCLATPNRRKFLFGMLYLSEGAPIGFIWLGLPTRMRAIDVPVDQITWLMAALILPWTLKFLWAPVIDLLRVPGWGFKHWILSSQFLMAATLLPLMWLDIKTQFSAMAIWLMLHAVCAATQDISIDALCVHQSSTEERGSLNGWMQCGVLLGRAAMGGGALVLEEWIGFPGVVGVLMGLILISATLLMFSIEQQASRAGDLSEGNTTFFYRVRAMFRELWYSVRASGIWAGLLFTLTAPAAFKSLEAVIGPFLIDHGCSSTQVGRFTATMMIGGMIAGSLFAGQISSRFTQKGFLATALVLNLVAILTVAVTDFLSGEQMRLHLFALLTVVAFTIGWFTVALYTWLMHLTSPRLAATQFTAFMAASNACEAWSTSLMGSLQVYFGYPIAILILCGISAIAGGMILKQIVPDNAKGL